MHFTRVSPKKLCSDSGFCVEVANRTDVNYTEGDLTVAFEAEMLAGPSGYAVRKIPESARNATGIVHLTSSEVDRIFANVQSAFKFEGYDIVQF